MLPPTLSSAFGPTICHRSKPPFVSRTIAHQGWSKNPTTLPFSTPDDTWRRQLEQFLKGSNAAILGVTLFGDKPDLTAMIREIRRHGIDAPQTALIGAADGPGGVEIATYAGTISTPLFDGDRLVGSFFEDSEAKYCVLGNLAPTNLTLSRPAQTEAVLETMQKILAGVGLHFHDVVRTWFFVDRILDWYGGFNSARTAFFQRHDITRMPASTGVGASNLNGAALMAKAIAVQPKSKAITIRTAESPLQCEALAYGSTFSRAMEVATPRERSLYISGTASIEPGGKTAFLGDAACQVEKTMEVVNALLEKAGMEWADTTRAIAYFRHTEHTGLWNDYCRARQLPHFPALVTQCDICRDDLLFEIELDAQRAR